MATKVRTRNIAGDIPEAYPTGAGVGYEDMDTLSFSSTQASIGGLGTESAVYPGEKVEIESAGLEAFGFWSERVLSEVTISGTITFNIWRTHNASFLAWMRVRLLKVTTANVETLICQADAPQTTGTATVLNFTGTPTPTTVGPGERFILRISWVPITPGVWGSTTPSVNYGGSTAGSLGDTYISFTETITFQPNITILYMRRTTANGIGTFFDALPTIGVTAFTTADVNTVAAGTQIQWTRTAGGTVLEFITPRMKHPGWSMQANTYIQSGFAFASESNLLANCGLRMKLFKRAATGTETPFYTVSRVSELGTTRASQGLTGGTVDAVVQSYEDDRMVIRFYIINIGTMASGYTCNIAYDGTAAAGFDGTISLHLLSFPFLKAEGDPSAPNRADMSMTGLGG